MKKLLMILMVTVAGSTSFAQSYQSEEANAGETLHIVNKEAVGKSLWITIYNTIGKISDTTCLPAGQITTFDGYKGPVSFVARAEVKENANCSGNTLADMRQVMGSGWSVTADKNSRGQYLFDSDSNETSGTPVNTISLGNRISDNHSVWVTVYNAVGRISDTACVRAGKVKLFDNYVPQPLKYELRTEVKQNEDCSGDTLADMNLKTLPGENRVISDDRHGHYFLD